MANITITMKDGTVHEFREYGRPGGSWHNSLRYEDGFVVVRDEWEEETAFPTADVAMVKKNATRGAW